MSEIALEGLDMMSSLEEEKMFEELALLKSIDHIQNTCHTAAIRTGWWNDLTTGESTRGKRNVGEQIALMHSELSEALEAYRKNLKDDKLPNRNGLEVELADCIIRIFDFAGGFDLDLAGAIVDKLKYNADRADHQHENRIKENGKAF